jgi:hypothetical protein
MRVFGIEGGFGRLCKNPPQELSPKQIDRLQALTLFGEVIIGGLGSMLGTFLGGWFWE